MAAPFNTPINITKGTYVPNGLRTGVDLSPPLPSVPNTSVTNSTNVPSVSNYIANGGGIYLSPEYTYRFIPYAGTVGNIVALTSVSQNGWLTLSGDGMASTLCPVNSAIPYSIVRQPNTIQNPKPTAQFVQNAGYTTTLNPPFPEGAPNQTYLQFDYPRVPAVGLYNTSATPPGPGWGKGASMTAATNITIFGFDQYYQPMQHTYTVSTVVGDEAGPNQYPGYMFGAGTAGQVNCKAFFGITGIYCNGTTSPGTQLHVYTCNTFGLPFALSDYGDIKSFTMNNYDLKNASIIGEIPAGAASGPLTTYLADDAYAAYNQLAAAASNSPVLSPLIVQAGDTANVLSISNVYRYNAGANGFGDKGFITVQLSAAVTAGNKYTYSIYFPNSSRYLVSPGFNLNEGSNPANVSTATTVDVRGLLILPDMKAGSTAETALYDLPDVELYPNGARICSFTYYVKGADQQINVAAAGKQPKGFLPTPTAPVNTPGQVQSLEFKDLYGYKQYYTGVIS